MENVLTQFFSIETVVFCIGIYMLVLGFRKAIESAAPYIAPIFPDKFEPWWIEFWREWLLPNAPIIFGALIAVFVVDYPYPEVFAKSWPGRFFFGLVAGGASGNTYRFANYYIKKLVPKKTDELKKKIDEVSVGGSIPPPAAEELKKQIDDATLEE